MAWEYGFLETAAEVFELLVIGILPIVVIVILVVYMNKIIRAFIETRKAKAQLKKKPKQDTYLHLSGKARIEERKQP
jgi:sorbitol-specific phosphotransferase system component IIC